MYQNSGVLSNEALCLSCIPSVVYIVITDYDTFVLMCTLPPKYTYFQFNHEVGFSWVKILGDSTFRFDSTSSLLVPKIPHRFIDYPLLQGA